MKFPPLLKPPVTRQLMPAEPVHSGPPRRESMMHTFPRIVAPVKQQQHIQPSHPPPMYFDGSRPYPDVAINVKHEPGAAYSHRYSPYPMPDSRHTKPAFAPMTEYYPPGTTASGAYPPTNTTQPPGRLYPGETLMDLSAPTPPTHPRPPREPFSDPFVDERRKNEIMVPPSFPKPPGVHDMTPPTFPKPPGTGSHDVQLSAPMPPPSLPPAPMPQSMQQSMQSPMQQG
eukprot:Colp12_sorted_trinity150504_noHs@11928